MTFHESDHPRDRGQFTDKTQAPAEVALARPARRSAEQIAADVADTVSYYDDPNPETDAYEPIIEDRGQLASFIVDGIEADRKQNTPRYRPAGEPDEHRDEWEKLRDSDVGEDGVWKLRITGSDDTDRVSTKLITITSEQADRILAMLSMDRD